MISLFENAQRRFCRAVGRRATLGRSDGMDTLARPFGNCLKNPGRLGGALLVVCLAAVLPVSAQKHRDVENIGIRDINRGSMNFYSIEKEIALGREISRNIDMTTILLRDPEVQGYVNDVVQRLVRNSDANLPFSVKVIDSDDINAFALPGGFLYVNTGLIIQAHSEAELAGMLAHEIAHVTARHYTKGRSKARIFQWASLPLIFLGGPAGAAIYQGLGLTGPLALLKFARNDEKQADMLGLQYAYRAGYDPAALVDILERLGGNEKIGEISKIFMTHPMKDKRIQLAQKQIEEMLPGQEQYVISTAAFDRIRARLTRQYRNRNIYYPDNDHGPRLRRRTHKRQEEEY